ncbi:ArsC family reductase [Alkalimonas amylolytica]|uniref:Transcriptional regulator, Spx/MgsR family n=1 Tax=Alkalimonas amylolytica TaxID=152573 RepID=A0A1H4AZ72_ALKAM|nr:ArsC family reductase [Alkalimonas amylolytica]SEA41213.1 transcriptional regulator, Spx/MgsR family [Alkalimonas amylolytica]
MITLYGIPNCDTIKKARRWLEQQQEPYQFIDYREQPLGKEQLQAAIEELGYDKVLNNRSTTYRQLPATDKDKLNSSKALQLLLQHPTLIKRPLLHCSLGYRVGFSEASYQQLLEQLA